MENRTTILNELREISAVVTAVGHQNPYTVPVGYFEGLAEQLVNRVLAQGSVTVLTTINPYQVPQGYFDALPEQLLQSVKANMVQAKKNPYEAPQGYFNNLPEQLLQSAKANLVQAKNIPYEVPNGYFEGLADQLLSRVKDTDVQLSDTLQKAKNISYEVPQGYFESLPATMLNRVKADNAASADEELEMLSPLLKQIGKKNPFSTPAGYFAELTDNTMAGAQAIDFVNSELENTSPLQGLQQKQVYEVPQNYFEQLPGQLLQKVQPSGKVVSMGRRLMQYAAAAVVAGVLVTAGWMYLGSKSDNGSITPPVVAAKLDKVSDEVLENYLEDQTIIPAEATVAVSNEIDMKEMLADVPDEDLQVYLEKYNTSKDIITN